MILKIGGAALTDKSRRNTLLDDGNVLSTVAETIGRRSSTTATNSTSLVIVHGAGSFGHMSAQEHGFGDSSHLPAEPDACSEVRHGVSRLS